MKKTQIMIGLRMSALVFWAADPNFTTHIRAQFIRMQKNTIAAARAISVGFA